MNPVIMLWINGRPYKLPTADSVLYTLDVNLTDRHFMIKTGNDYSSRVRESFVLDVLTVPFICSWYPQKA
jgi:hypothetical protein